MTAARKLDIRAVVDILAALKGIDITVEVQANSSHPAPRAILSGVVGSLSMDDESGAEDRGLIFLPIAAEGRADPGRCPGIYFVEEHFAWAEETLRLTIALKDQTSFVIERRA